METWRNHKNKGAVKHPDKNGFFVFVILIQLFADFSCALRKFVLGNKGFERVAVTDYRIGLVKGHDSASAWVIDKHSLVLSSHRT